MFEDFSKGIGNTLEMLEPRKVTELERKEITKRVPAASSTISLLREKERALRQNGREIERQQSMELELKQQEPREVSATEA